MVLYKKGSHTLGKKYLLGGLRERENCDMS